MLQLLALQQQRRLQIEALDVEIQSLKAAGDELELQLLANSFVISATLGQSLRTERRLGAHTRRSTWFEETLPRLGEQHFRASFRVSAATFRYLVEVCQPRMRRQETRIRKSISIEKRVGIALYRLCSSAEDRTIANLFAVGRSSVNEIYREFCKVVVEEIEHNMVTMVRNEDLEDHMREFQVVLGLPHTLGVLDGCHLAISPPQEEAVDYYNCKGW